MRRPAQLSGVTLKMVAAKAGVSAATVSYVLRGQARAMRLSERCERRVLEAASELGYQAHQVTPTTTASSPSTLGVVVNRGTNSTLAVPFWAMVSSGIESEVRRHGYDLQFIASARTSSPCLRALAQLRARRVDALIICRLLQAEIPGELLDPQLPVVFIESHDLPGVNRVLFDPEPGLDAAIAHLAGLGHRHLVLLQLRNNKAGERSYGLTELPDRGEVLRRLAARAGMPLTELLLESASRDAADTPRPDIAGLELLLDRHLRLPEDATAVLCENDEMALALYRHLAKRGQRVPDDWSVVGFDDLFAASTVVPPLTTITHRLEDLGSAAVALALEILAGGREPGGVQRVLTAGLTLRHSTAAPRPGPPPARR
jgi:LacI family repressor for deo operon, udp, cdd, tsx, nupC, and nupG